MVCENGGFSNFCHKHGCVIKIHTHACAFFFCHCCVYQHLRIISCSIRDNKRMLPPVSTIRYRRIDNQLSGTIISFPLVRIFFCICVPCGGNLIVSFKGTIKGFGPLVQSPSHFCSLSKSLNVSVTAFNIISSL